MIIKMLLCIVQYNWFIYYVQSNILCHHVCCFYRLIASLPTQEAPAEERKEEEEKQRKEKKRKEKKRKEKKRKEKKRKDKTRKEKPLQSYLSMMLSADSTNKTSIMRHPVRQPD